MEIWIPITIAAAFSQNLRFMLQKHLKSTQLSTAGATLARFLFASPFVVLIMAVYASRASITLPVFPPVFAAYVVVGGIAQIIGTMGIVALFAERNFAIGITFKNTEVILSALVGFIVLGDAMSGWGVAAIVIGLVGLVFLSDPPDVTGGGFGRIFNRASGLGIMSGLAFAFSAVSYRGAALSFETGDVFLRAGLTLAVVTTFQTLILGLWLILREPGELTRVVVSWRVSLLVGITSMIGSFGWFTAMTLQTAAYVKGLGQIELLFSFLASYFFYKEKITQREIIGTIILMVSILLLILAI